jgi:hypothetical protein
VAEAAGLERPELASKLELPSGALPYSAFRSALQGSSAKLRTKLLAKFGMVEPALPV